MGRGPGCRTCCEAPLGRSFAAARVASEDTPGIPRPLLPALGMNVTVPLSSWRLWCSPPLPHFPHFLPLPARVPLPSPFQPCPGMLAQDTYPCPTDTNSQAPGMATAPSPPSTAFVPNAGMTVALLLEEVVSEEGGERPPGRPHGLPSWATPWAELDVLPLVSCCSTLENGQWGGQCLCLKWQGFTLPCEFGNYHFLSVHISRRKAEFSFKYGLNISWYFKEAQTTYVKHCASLVMTQLLRNPN